MYWRTIDAKILRDQTHSLRTIIKKGQIGGGQKTRSRQDLILKSTQFNIAMETATNVYSKKFEHIYKTTISFPRVCEYGKSKEMKLRL